MARRPDPESLRPMATQMQTHHDVLHATDTALRLVNQALGDLGTADDLAPAASRTGASRTTERGAAGSGGRRSLVSTLVRADAEVASLVDRIKQSRGRIQEASDARLDQLSRRLDAVMTELEREAQQVQDPIRQARYRALREELCGHLQFRDITSQLGYAVAVLTDTEQRLEQLATLFDPFAAVPTGPS